MQEIIASILEAEKKADEIVKSAAEKSKEIKRNAEDDGEKIKSGAIARFKIHRAAELKSAEEKAGESYEAVLADGKKQAETVFNNSADAINGLAKEIVDGITG